MDTKSSLTMEEVFQALAEAQRVTMPRVIVTVSAVYREQFRFPKSRKRRVRKKWSKRERNWRVLPQCYRVCQGDTETWVIHPTLWEKLKTATFAYRYGKAYGAPASSLSA